AYGLGNAMSFPLSVGASAALLPLRPTPETVLAVMRRHRPTVFYGVPSLFASMLAHPELTRGAGSDRLRLCVSAGEALPAELGEGWGARVGVDLIAGSGACEMLAAFVRQSPRRLRDGHHDMP